jgi:hypothetical protein
MQLQKSSLVLRSQKKISRTLDDEATKKCMKAADKEIVEHGGMGDDTIIRTRNHHFVKKMLVGIGDTNTNSDDAFKKPKKIGRELMDLIVHKTNLLSAALNTALQTDKVTDF